MVISQRAKLLFAGVLVLIAVVLILLFWPHGVKTATVQNPAVTNTQTNTAITKPTVSTTTPIIPVSLGEATAQTIAKSFVERFGSYSSESEAANLVDLLPLVTDSYKAKLQSQINTLQAAVPAAKYYGVSTRMISLKTNASDSASASFDLVTQREETNGSLSNTSVKYQTITIAMKLVGTSWLVDSATWK